MHGHNCVELVFVPSGRAVSYIEQSECKISGGNYFFIDYNTRHAYKKLTDDFYVINCLFEPQFIDSAFAACGSFNELCELYAAKTLKTQLSEPVSNRIFTADEDVKQLFYKLWNEYEQKRNGYAEIIRGTVCEIIIRTMRSIGGTPKFSSVTDYIIKEVGRRYKDPLTLNTLCSELHFSPSYASAAFHSDTKLTFTQYLQMTRIKEACNMLVYTELSVTEIAESVGYNSIKHFNCLFKSITKVSPREYRKLNRK